MKRTVHWRIYVWGTITTGVPRDANTSSFQYLRERLWRPPNINKKRSSLLEVRKGRDDRVPVLWLTLESRRSKNLEWSTKSNDNTGSRFKRLSIVLFEQTDVHRSETGKFLRWENGKIGRAETLLLFKNGVRGSGGLQWRNTGLPLMCTGRP